MLFRSDWLNGGAGADTLVYDTAKGNDTVYGGTGGDTLQFLGVGESLDLSSSHVHQIETISLGAGGCNTLTLTVQEVLDLSDTDTLVVAGDSSDALTASGGWTDTHVASTIGGVTYEIYTGTAGGTTAHLLVDTSDVLQTTIS